MTLPGTVRRMSRTVEGLALLALPHGGQQVARRNAWASMAADSARARARREADAALTLAAATAAVATAPRAALAR
jgi:hypothetical protein